VNRTKAKVLNAGNSLFTFSKIAFLLIIAQATINTEKAACISVLICSQVFGSIASEKARAYITGTYTASGKAGNAKKSGRRFSGITCYNKLPDKPLIRLYGFK